MSFRFRASPGVAPIYDNKYQKTRVRMHVYGRTSANFVKDFYQFARLQETRKANGLNNFVPYIRIKIISWIYLNKNKLSWIYLINTYF